MDLRERVTALADALMDPAGFDVDAWAGPGARVALPSVGLDRDLREVLRAFAVLPLASCEAIVVRAVRNVVMVNWDVTRTNGGGGQGSAVLSFDREGRVSHMRLDGALLAGR